ncbi:MAG: hypothetical protein Q4E09_03575 [Eubacteriales bacterium]|nr:hypothetical protein [Eubacteriales bacterium]
MMWQNKSKPGSPKPDTPMKHLARQVLTTKPDDQEVKVRSVNLAVRFGEPEMPDTVQEDLDHLTDLTAPLADGKLKRTKSDQATAAKLEALEREAPVESFTVGSESIGQVKKDVGEFTSKAEVEVAATKAELSSRNEPPLSTADAAKSSTDEAKKQIESNRSSAAAHSRGSSEAEKTERDEQKNQIRQAKLYANMGIAPRPIKEAELTIRSPKLREESLSGHRPRRFDSFADIVSYAQGQFPNPREMQLQQKPEYQTWLMAQLANCHSRADLERLAYSMDYKDLAIIFPTLASLKTGAEIDKLLRLLVIRPSKYLYIQGWLTLQYAYPRSTVQKGLAILCEVLEESEVTKHTLQVEEMAHLDGLVLGQKHFDWKSVHLISEISLPNTRHFMSSIIKFLRDSQMSGEDFFQRYGIYRDLALGQAITSQWEMAAFESSIHIGQPAQSLFARV